ncbi:MAG: nucleotidyltransferase family protein [Planctomycetota bacterium]|nr:nucleotidyltransferase family protein [Planctomycetota bacterium]MDA1142018.1 nucleotidyltransferase family protein [Planctomycetota bacterium]
MTLNAIRQRREQILELAQRHGAKNVRVFGSMARDEAGESSDIDFLVDFEPGRSLLDMSELKQDLHDLLSVDVDVVTERGLYWLLRRRIFKEARPL